MSWLDRFIGRRGRTDQIDGYSPSSPKAPEDPWATREALDAMERHVGKTKSRADAQAFDGFRNELTGIGSWQRDKTFGGRFGGPQFELPILTGFECELRWRGSDLGQKIIECMPDEMTREGCQLTVQPSREDAPKEDADDPPEGMKPPAAALLIPDADDGQAEIIERMATFDEQLTVDAKIRQALCFERAYGGGAILIGADDGLPLTEPLDLTRIKSLTHLTALTGGWDGECVAWSWNAELTGKDYGTPDMYMVRNIGTPIAKVPAPGERIHAQPASILDPYGSLIYWVHASRLLIFPGPLTSHRARVQMRGWGDSIFTRVDRVLQQYDQTWGGLANLMTDFSQGVLSVKGLLEMMGGGNKTKNAQNNLTARAMAIQLTRSIANILLIDSEEEFKRDTVAVAGVAEVLQQFAQRMAGAADMPVELLFSQMNSGALNKGDTTLRFFYDKVRAKQNTRMIPQRKHLMKLAFVTKEGPTMGVEPERWTVVPTPLFQLNDKEMADVRNKQADTDTKYIQAGVVTPEEICVSRFAGSKYSTDTTVDLEGRRQMSEQMAADRAAHGEIAKTATGVSITPTAAAAVMTVNEARAASGLPPLMTPAGVPDPEGNLFMSEYMAKHAAAIGQAVQAEAGDPTPSLEGPAKPAGPPAKEGMPPPKKKKTPKKPIE